MLHEQIIRKKIVKLVVARHTNMRKLVVGVGFNDTSYEVQHCPFYIRWKSMLVRCYDKNYLKHRATYEKCTVCDEWLTFSNFKKWMEVQDWEGKVLDKDILSGDIKIYSPETCVFIDQKVNNLLLDSGRTRGAYPIGVTYDAKYGYFISRCSNGSNKSVFLGIYTNATDAHEAWRKYKHDLACKLAEQQTNPRVAEALRNKYKIKENTV